jgi:hypothetical protein
LRDVSGTTQNPGNGVTREASLKQKPLLASPLHRFGRQDSEASGPDREGSFTLGLPERVEHFSGRARLKPVRLELLLNPAHTEAFATPVRHALGESLSG